MTRTSHYYIPSQQFIANWFFTMEYNMANNVRQLYLPAGIFFLYNPYQQSDGVIAKLACAVQKPNNINATHPGLCPIYYALQEEPLGSTICIAVFWFGDGYPYNPILVGPFGDADNYHEQLQMDKNATGREGRCA